MRKIFQAILPESVVLSGSQTTDMIFPGIFCYRNGAFLSWMALRRSRGQGEVSTHAGIMCGITFYRTLTEIRHDVDKLVRSLRLTPNTCRS
ncbi:hypothetical protein DES53_101370 [Roseimicrobium gellanilyticum]|uniref:Uncharacterized protein n=1 Tax=Roseimicrobium gellanilyticum TaxID=748857 RepID=A0A366HTG2_9BACT|nr:hypothetical protein DES53_101370 [Roseimicrobium gellanilyticum]